MDTNPMGQIGLDAQTQANNYNVFSELMKKGVDLKKMVSEYDDMKTKLTELPAILKRVGELEEKLKKSTVEDVKAYELMERAVKDDAGVKDATEMLARQKSITLHNICMSDNAYASAYSAKRLAVEEAYAKRSEVKSEQGRAAPAIRQDTACPSIVEKGVPTSKT